MDSSGLIAQLFGPDKRSRDEGQSDAHFPQAHFQKALPSIVSSLTLHNKTPYYNDGMEHGHLPSSISSQS